MTKLILVVLLGLLMAGCEPPPTWGNDQALRAKLFHQCLERIPKGPSTTVYKDWAEVVEACEDAAYWQSRVILPD